MAEQPTTSDTSKIPWIFTLPLGIKVMLCVVLLFSTFSIWKQATTTLIPVSEYYMNENRQTVGADFTAFYTASVIASKNDYQTLFSGKGFDDVRVDIFKSGAGDLMLYGYPPTALLLWSQLYKVEYTTALYMWIFIGMVSVGILIYMLTRNLFFVFLGITSPYALWGITTGQTGLICASILTAGFIAYQKKMPCTAGSIFGLLIFKPHLALALPFCLLASRNWKIIIAGLISGSIMIGLSLLFFGVEAWTEFAQNMLNNSAPQLENNSGLFKRIPTIYVTVNYLFDNKTIALICHLLGTFFAIGTCFYVWRNTKNVIAQLICLYVTPAFIFPYYYDYDLSCLAILLVLLVNEIFKSPSTNWQYFLPIVTWFMGMSIYLVSFNGLLLGPLFLLGLMGYAIYLTKLKCNAGDLG